MPTVYEIARNLKLPGVFVSAHLDPATIPPRMFNSIHRMIKTGVAVGWSSQAAQVAKRLMRDHHVSFVETSPYGVATAAILNPSIKDEVLELYEAYITVQTAQAQPGSRADYTKYWEQRRADLEAMFRPDYFMHKFIQVSNQHYRAQIALLMASARHPDDIAAGEALAARFRAGEKFPIQVI